MGRRCLGRTRHIPGASALWGFPTRMSSGWEPINLNFRVTAGSSSRSASSPGSKETAEVNLRRQKEETTEKTPAVRRTAKAEKSLEEGAEGTSGAVSGAACQWQARETPGTPPAPRDAAEGQEAVHPNSGHALGRVWPQQVKLSARADTVQGSSTKTTNTEALCLQDFVGHGKKEISAPPLNNFLPKRTTLQSAGLSSHLSIVHA
ncbi:hypothetical protein NDU88_004970 [Pleurodeles waltl]|uniref:Uncharacterized protein n=1 Tax=Pleurodeles waltl TaxID=8319 RepID=A0AAV7TU09_PLEWA|nr:hypothetical protein NDU88_004970 [Pleurodeles waltl]